MSTIPIDPHIKPRIQPNAFCRNAQVPSALFQGEIMGAVNRVARYRPKELFRSGGNVTSIIDNATWRFAGHVGPMAGRIILRARMALASTDLAPKVQLTLVNGSGATLGTGTASYGYARGMTINDTPDEWGTATIVINASSFRDTSVRGIIQGINAARIISCVVYEEPLASDTINGYLRQQFSVGAPILDTDRSAAQNFAVSLYKRNAAPLFTFSSRSDTTAPSTASVTYVGINSTSSGTASSPGYAPRLTYCKRKMSTTVPVRIECCASVAVTGSGSVRVVNISGAVIATFPVVATVPTWFQTTANLPADHSLYFLEHKGDSKNAIKTYAVSIYQYA